MDTCCRCFLPIHKDDRVAHLGDRVGHDYQRCVSLLRARVEEFERLARMVVDGQLTETEHERGIGVALFVEWLR